jgi:hypothetical protein
MGGLSDVCRGRTRDGWSRPRERRRSAQGAALEDGAVSPTGTDGVGGALGRGAAGSAGVEEVVLAVGVPRVAYLGEPHAQKAEGAGLGHLVEEGAGVAIDRVGDLGGLAQGRAAGQEVVVRAFELERDHAPREVAGLEAGGDLLAQTPDVAVEEVAVRGVGGKGGLVRHALDVAVRADGAVVLASGQVPQPLSHAPEAGVKVAAVPAEEVADEADSSAVERLLARGSDAPDEPDGAAGKEVTRLGAPDDGEAAGLVEVGGDLGEELVVRQAYGAGEAQLFLHPLGEEGEHDGGWRPVQPFGAGKVKEGLVEAQRLDAVRQLLHQGADRPGRVDIGGEPGLHHRGLGAEAQGLVHGHGRPDAADAGEVAGGGDDAATAAAHDHGAVAEFGVVALLHGGEEGVAVHVRDG